MQKDLYVITGVMASGKSSVSEALAARFARAVHLRGDAFRRMIVSGREEMQERPSGEAMRQLVLRYQLAADAARSYHRAGFTVIVQDNYLGSMLPYFIGLLAPLVPKVIVLCPTVEAIRAREAARAKTGYHGYAVEALYDDFIRTTPRIGLWIDSSDQTIAQTVDAILSKA